MDSAVSSIATPPAAARAHRSQALDDLIMGTNSSSIVSKRSVERLYYPDEPHYFRYFVKKFQRRAPLINRGYWLRLKAIDTIVKQFLLRCDGRKVVINLGCGSDVLPWQSNVRYGGKCSDALFIDIDYADLMHRKRAVVLETPQLKELLGSSFEVSKSDKDILLLKSERYCQIGCDLRDLQALRHVLETLADLSQCPVLFVAEVSITYIDTESADRLLEWASSVGKAEFCLLEQIMPYGRGHPFAQTMLLHFDKLKTPPRSVRSYPTINDQSQRFKSRGWPSVRIWDLWDAWSCGEFVNVQERVALDDIEPFDEWEEFMLFARHYFPSFGSILCNSPVGSSDGKPTGLLCGGIETSGLLAQKKYQWTLDIASEHPTITFAIMSQNFTPELSIFGASCVEIQGNTLICGGIGADQAINGQAMYCLTSSESKVDLTRITQRPDDAATKPFMIGTSVLYTDDHIVIAGGGATCFSMGTFWETNVYQAQVPTILNSGRVVADRRSMSTEIKLMSSQRVTSSTSAHRGGSELGRPDAKARISTIARVSLSSETDFEDIILRGQPVVIENLQLGDCLKRWTVEYMTKRVGSGKKVVVHECQPHDCTMNFTTKNFRYVTEDFGTILARASNGERLYLRSLSNEKPAEQPAKLEDDFPDLAADFVLPRQLDYVKKKLFSSVLRVSGKINMWLHYDVMANVYAQIIGTKRMMLFPPSDVPHLAFAPGASSSSVDVFTLLETPKLAHTRPHEAIVGPGDVLFLPPLWLHTATPLTDMSVAVNVFFRDLDGGYATGRDVYGNRDLAAYEKGRHEVAKIAKEFHELPEEIRKFYLASAAEEQAARDKELPNGKTITSCALICLDQFIYEERSLLHTAADMPATGRLLRRMLLPGAAVTTGAVLVYSYRPRNIPGHASAAVPPPTYALDGSFTMPRFPHVKSRQEQLDALRLSGSDSTDAEYDMLVIGGGATGAGVALDATTRGLRVAVVERDDFSSGTSSKSTKLVHGGVRYLEKAVWNLDYNQYKLVREALTERKYFLQTAPHLSMWLPIMLPLDKWWKAPYYWAGTKFYDVLAGSEGIESSYFLTRSKALEAFPMLKQTDLVGALVYYDGAHNDSRMNVSIAMTAALYGATVANHTEVTGLLKDDNGHLCGAKIRDNIAVRNGKPIEDFTVRAKCVVNCTGPFTDAIRKMDDESCKEIVAPSSGVHVILPGYYSPGKMGLLDPSTSDGRVIFFLPWQGNTIAGTTDSPCAITPNPVPDEESIKWILDEIRGYLSPEIRVRRGDVLAAWSGIRPLVKDPKAKNTESLVRNHLIDVSRSGLLTCAGGKWTTYRQMAEDCVDVAVKEFGLNTKAVENAPRVSGTNHIDDGAILDGKCQTHNVRLIGAHGFSKTLFIPLIQYFGVETEVAKHLTESYGDRAWSVAALCKQTTQRFPARGERISQLYPFVDGEVRYACRHEYAQTPVDILARRTRLAFLSAQAALEALPKVIDIMAEELKWDHRRQEREWDDTVDFLKYMGLPQPLQSATRKQVEQGKLDFASSLEWNMYSRHDKPQEN
ncbi:hypothetical protein MY8738_010154 [Beauveria namnaoensis]